VILMKKPILMLGASALALGLAGAPQAQANNATAEVNWGLGATVSGNNITDSGNLRDNDVGGSFNGGTGIQHIQQNNGSSSSVKAASAILANINGTLNTVATARTNAWTQSNRFSTQDDDRSNLIENSFKNFSGITKTQQNNGDVSDVGSSTAVYAGLPLNSNGTATNSANAQSRSLGNVGGTTRNSARDNNVDDAYDNASGIAKVQQNNGDANALSQSTSVAANLEDSQGDLSSVRQAVNAFGAVARSSAADSNSTRQNGIGRTDDAFDRFEGIAEVQQNNGDLNAMGQATALAANLDSTGNATKDADSRQNVRVEGRVVDTYTHDNEGTRDNLIDDSFDAARGILNVQQNNGNGNAIGTGVGVTANLGGVSPQDDHSQSVRVTGSLERNGAGVPIDDLNSDRDNRITDSFRSSEGVTAVQQNNGDRNVMGVGTAVVANVNDGTLGGVGSPVQSDVNQTVDVSGTLRNPDLVVDSDANVGNGYRDNNINDSFNRDASGIASVQQNNGTQNIMGIGTAVVINDRVGTGVGGGNDDVVQNAMVVGGLIDSASATVSGGNSPDIGNSNTFHRRNDIQNDAFDGYEGIASVQQNNGDNNIVGAGSAVAATVNAGDEFDSADQRTTTNGRVNSAVAGVSNPFGATDRSNDIDDSFDGSSALVNVQQNNGNNNVMSAGNGVTVNVLGRDTVAGRADARARSTGSVTNSNATVGGNADRSNRINDSFNSDAQGIVTIQQNNGDNNVLGASHSVAVDVVANPGQLTEGWGPASATATLGGAVAGNTTVVQATIGGPGLVNSVNNSGNGFAGAGSIQQNNGSNSVVLSSIAVAATITD
jgi:hypothetical protein